MPENEIVEEIDYKNRKIAVVKKEAEQELRIDRELEAAARDADIDTYQSPNLPYRSFGSLQDLGKARVDETLGEGQADE